MRIPRNSIDANIKCNAFVRFLQQLLKQKPLLTCLTGESLMDDQSVLCCGQKKFFDELPPASFS